MNLNGRDEIACEDPRGRVEASRASDLHRTIKTSGDRTTEIHRLRDRGSPNKSDTWTHLDAEIEIGWWEKARS